MLMQFDNFGRGFELGSTLLRIQIVVSAGLELGTPEALGQRSSRTPTVEKAGVEQTAVLSLAGARNIQRNLVVQVVSV